MRKSFKWILAIFVIASVFCGVGCKPEVESDKTAPADVTNFFAENKDSSVLLTWVDAEDKDVYGYEITWDGSVSNNRSAAMEKNSMMVAPGLEMCYINNLINGNKYTFTIKTVDTSGNKSLGVSVSIIPEYIDRIPPSQIENIVITYSKNLNKFLLSWINPDDEDFAGVILFLDKMIIAGWISCTACGGKKSIVQHSRRLCRHPLAERVIKRSNRFGEN